MMYQVVSLEDDSQIAELLSFVLRHPQLTVHTAHDGAAGLELIRTIKPHLVLMDLMMPIMNGWEVYDTVRADPALCEIPIIIVSVMTEQHQRKRKFVQSPLDSYFTKPFDVRLLRGAIERMLNISLWEEPNPPLRATGEFDTSTPAEQQQQAPATGTTTPTPSPQSSDGSTTPPAESAANETPKTVAKDTTTETNQPPSTPAAASHPKPGADSQQP